MSATLTVTGTIGPDIDVTAQVFTNVISFTIDCVGNTITFYQSSTPSPTCIEISAATTITATKSGSTYTLVIS